MLRAALQCVAALVLLSGAARAETIATAFTVLGPDGPIARAVTDGASCPALQIDGRAVAMQERAHADAAHLVCEAPIPAGTTSAAIGDAALPLPKAKVQRIVVFGDSGCRIDQNETTPCNELAAWPFPRTSVTAATLAPDLVIEVGDYYYRELACPAGNAGCTGSPHGDDWPSWQADFFEPAAPLLRAAPWVMVRGNHENCSRGGTGFFRLLDPRPVPQQCPLTSPAYLVKTGGLALVVLDSGEALDDRAPDALVATYRSIFQSIDAPPGAWLLTHRPVWAPTPVRGVMFDMNATLQAASDNHLPAGISLVLAGHIHLFEALSFADRRPPTLVLGTAGSSLDRGMADGPNDTLSLTGHAIAGTTIADGRAVHAFGITTLESNGSEWAAIFRDEAGTPRFTCQIAPGQLDCDHQPSSRK